MTKINPCPFCEMEDEGRVLVKTEGPDLVSYRVFCLSCGAMGPSHIPSCPEINLMVEAVEAAIRLWNIEETGDES